MDPRHLAHTLTPEESRRFERDGFFAVDEAIPDGLIQRLRPVCDRIDREERERQGKGPGERINHFDFIGRDEIFLELLDWGKTFPKVWGILGWHIQLYHTHMMITPPEPAGRSLAEHGLDLGWHQDTGLLNQDLETEPRPRVSLKVGYFLTDTSEEGRGNFYVVPGSHLRNEFPGPDRKTPVDGAVAVRVPPGTAVFFDRRLWHSGSANYWHEARRVLFYGYSYRWLRPRDDMTVEHYLDRCDPIRKQLLGVSYSGGHGYTSPKPEDVPLRAWLEEHGAAAPVEIEP